MAKKIKTNLGNEKLNMQLEEELFLRRFYESEKLCVEKAVIVMQYMMEEAEKQRLERKETHMEEEN